MPDSSVSRRLSVEPACKLRTLCTQSGLTLESFRSFTNCRGFQALCNREHTKETSRTSSPPQQLRELRELRELSEVRDPRELREVHKVRRS
mmetsp:Transcript_148608/g.262413  ORF Transcript_148608/g.262413 Transcript_148608/m.262413 type:complete len:91 (+) Transcript_148608:94-366(+)